MTHVPSSFRQWYFVLTWLGGILVILGFQIGIYAHSFPIPFYSIILLGAGLLVIGTVEIAINKDVSDGYRYFEKGLVFRRQRFPTTLSLFFEFLGIEIVVLSLVMMTASLL